MVSQRKPRVGSVPLVTTERSNRSQFCWSKNSLARWLKPIGKLLRSSELAVKEASVQPEIWRRFPSKSQPGQVPCSDRISSQRSGGGGGAGAATVGASGGDVAGASGVCPNDKASARRRG